MVAAHSVNSGVVTEPEHGKGGWELTSYQWDERTGLGHFQYTRSDGTRREVVRGQPRWFVLRGSSLLPPGQRSKGVRS